MPRLSHTMMHAPSQLGCFASHLKALAQADEPIFVFEDDFRPPEALARPTFERVHTLLNEGKFDLVVMAYSKAPFEPVEHDSVVRVISPYQGNILYGVSPAGAAKLLKKLLPMDGHIDNMMGAAAYASLHEDDPIVVGMLSEPLGTFGTESLLDHGPHSFIGMDVKYIASHLADYYKNPQRLLKSGRWTGVSPTKFGSLKKTPKGLAFERLESKTQRQIVLGISTPRQMVVRRSTMIIVIVLAALFAVVILILAILLAK